MPAIPKDRAISGEDWLAGRRARRRTGYRVAPEVIQRAVDPADWRLRRWFWGEWGLPSQPASEL